MLYESIKKLVQYGIDTGLTPESEKIYTINLLLDLFHEDDYEDICRDTDNIVLEDVLKLFLLFGILHNTYLHLFYHHIFHLKR